MNNVQRKETTMQLNEAIKRRMQQICAQKGKSLCDICLAGGMSPSALYDVFHGRTKHPTVMTVKRFCLGAQITMTEFFDAESFDDWEE